MMKLNAVAALVATTQSKIEQNEIEYDLQGNEMRLLKDSELKRFLGHEEVKEEPVGP